MIFTRDSRMHRAS